MPIPYPSGMELLYAHSGSSYSPYKYPVLYEHQMRLSVNPLWECVYCRQTNSRESLACTSCGAGQLRSVSFPVFVEE